ncbi:MerR family transcriptional regulator [Aeromicrobium alkaliterrae]|uniref:MerR family transcriptional regulator n=1 Tax=Aeromicrobium alkaliterrae TaxID=302168 RepID=A0ABP4VE44_9ACTN
MSTTDEPLAADSLSVEQLASRVGMTVRTVRFYAGRGLIPPPRREGRNGYYGADHLARLELVRELQAHGFTLSAIEGYLERIPSDATPAQVALHRTLLAPWSPEMPEQIDRATLETRSGRALTDDDLEILVAIGVVEPTPVEDQFRVAPAHLAVGIGFLDAGLPIDAALASRRLIVEHGTQLAEQLTELFRSEVWPHLKASGQPPELITAMVERFKPLTVQALVTSYEDAVDELKRRTVIRQTDR